MKKRTSKRATNPFALRLKFERTRLEKALKQAREMQKPRKRGMGGDDRPPHGPDSTTAMAQSILDVVVNALRRYKWCRDVEQALDDGIKFLQDHHNELTEEQAEDFRNDLAGLLGSYSDIC